MGLQLLAASMVCSAGGLCSAAPGDGEGEEGGEDEGGQGGGGEEREGGGQHGSSTANHHHGTVSSPLLSFMTFLPFALLCPVSLLPPSLF